MAHNGSDPDESGKLGVYWYELKRGADPKWTKHVFLSTKASAPAQTCAPWIWTRMATWTWW